MGVVTAGRPPPAVHPPPAGGGGRTPTAAERRSVAKMWWQVGSMPPAARRAAADDADATVAPVAATIRGRRAAPEAAGPVPPDEWRDDGRGVKAERKPWTEAVSNMDDAAGDRGCPEADTRGGTKEDEVAIAKGRKPNQEMGAAMQGSRPGTASTEWQRSHRRRHVADTHGSDEGGDVELAALRADSVGPRATRVAQACGVAPAPWGTARSCPPPKPTAPFEVGLQERSPGGIFNRLEITAHRGATEWHGRPEGLVNRPATF